MINLIFILCQYIFPILGIIGLFTDTFIMIILSIIFNIFQSFIGYYTGQLKPGSAHITSSIVIGLLISFFFYIEWYKGLCIIFSFGNIIILISSPILLLLTSALGKDTQENKLDN